MRRVFSNRDDQGTLYSMNKRIVLYSHMSSGEIKDMGAGYTWKGISITFLHLNSVNVSRFYIL